MTRTTHSKAKEGCPEIVTDVVPVTVVPSRLTTKRRTITPAAKKVNSSCVSPFVAPSVSSSIPTIKTRSVDSVDTVYV